MFLATDAVALSGARMTRDGYLVADARIARVGVYQYAGAELGRPDLPVVNVYRSEDVVFSKQAMASFANRPMTLDHPPENVTADNWKQYATGYTASEVARDGEFVRVPLIVTDAAAIAAIQAGKQELSCGYSCSIEFKDGVAPDGTAYQAVMTAIDGNHVASVDRGRAGSLCRIGDSWKDFNAADKGKPGDGERTPPIEGSNTMNLRKIVIDGLTIEVTDQGAEAVAKLQAQLADGKAAIDKAAKDAAEVKTAHDKALADKDKEITDLKAKIPTVDQLEEMFDRRAAVIDAAKKLAPDLDPKGKSLADVRKAVVAKRLGDGAVKDRSDDYIAAQFDALATLAKDGAADPDPVRDALKGGVTTTANDADKARQKYLEDQAKAWAA